MALDYLVFKKLINLIKEKIIDGRITKISQISNEEFLFIIRSNNANQNLLISTHPNMSYINLVNEHIESNHTTSNLLMLLRKHLDNGKIVKFEQQNDDRVVLMQVENRDDYYNTNIRNVYIELIGRASNLIMCHEDNKIIDSLKKIPLEYNNLRTIQPNITYVLPEMPSKTSIPYDIENEMKHLDVSYEEIVRRVNESDSIYISESKEGKKDFHFIPFTYMDGKVSKYTFNEGIEEFYRNSLVEERHRQSISTLDKFVRNEIKKSEKKVDKLCQELELQKEATIYKYYGDLLLTYCQGIKHLDPEMRVLDEETNKEVIIKIDNTLDVYRNANNYYKKYQKSKTALVKIQEQIDLCNENIEYFKSVKYALDNADIMGINEIKEELENEGYLRKQKSTIKTNKKPKVKVYKPLMYKIDGITVYAGQNNLQNEYLTFKMANKTHMFFHVAQGHGAHVVAFSDNLNLNQIKKIAIVAAYYSLYRNSSTVPVYYTTIKNVKKIPGGKPGKVIINNQKTIYVDPTDDFLK